MNPFEELEKVSYIRKLKTSEECHSVTYGEFGKISVGKIEIPEDAIYFYNALIKEAEKSTIAHSIKDVKDDRQLHTFSLTEIIKENDKTFIYSIGMYVAYKMYVGNCFACKTNFKIPIPRIAFLAFKKIRKDKKVFYWEKEGLCCLYSENILIEYKKEELPSAGKLITNEKNLVGRVIIGKEKGVQIKDERFLKFDGTIKKEGVEQPHSIKVIKSSLKTIFKINNEDMECRYFIFGYGTAIHKKPDGTTILFGVSEYSEE